MFLHKYSISRGWTADIWEIYCGALLRGILQMPNIFHERRWKLRRRDGWACVCACMCKADQKKAAHQKPAWCGARRCDGGDGCLQAAAASLGWTPWKRPKQRLPFICSPVFISLLSSRCCSSAGASWRRKLRKHCEVWFKLQVCELLRHHS